MQFQKINRVLGLGLFMTCLVFQEVFLTAIGQVEGFNELPQERELYNTLPGSDQKGTILDATNPMDLINQLRRATAMDNATSPSDAIDQALKAFEDNAELNSAEEIPNP